MTASTDCRTIFRDSREASAYCEDKKSRVISPATEATLQRLEKLLLAYLTIGTSPASFDDDHRELAMSNSDKTSGEFSVFPKRVPLLTSQKG